MTRRYYAPDLPSHGGLVSLSSAEAQHATRVMRVQVGDQVALFDGNGNETEAIVIQIARNECLCEAESASAVDREPPRSIHLGIALPKPDRARELIERLTELGVKTVTPLVTERTQRPPSNSLIEKLRRGVVEACKQSGRNQLLDLKPIQTASEYFANETAGIRWIAHPQNAADLWDAAVEDGEAQGAVVAIGPEGGWTDVELQLAKTCGFEPVFLGRRIYRVETAATVIAALLSSMP